VRTGSWIKIAAKPNAPGLNNQRLHAAIGYIPPAEAEKNYYKQRASTDKKTGLL